MLFVIHATGSDSAIFNDFSLMLYDFLWIFWPQPMWWVHGPAPQAGPLGQANGQGPWAGSMGAYGVALGSKPFARPEMLALASRRRCWSQFRRKNMLPT